MKHINTALLAIALLALTGCAMRDGQLTGAGSASYEYKRTLADGSSCTVTMLSGRDVMGGALAIDKDCAVTTKADSTSGAGEALQVIDNGITAIREIASKVP